VKLGRDWQAVYFGHHGHWTVDASGPGEDSDDPRDRYSLFDSLEDVDEEIHRLIAAAPYMQDAIREALEHLSTLDGGGPAIEVLGAAIARTKPQGTTEPS